MKTLLNEPYKSPFIYFLLIGWLLCVTLSAIIHVRMLMFLGVIFLIIALLFFTISLVYAFLPDGKDKQKPKQPCQHDQ